MGRAMGELKSLEPRWPTCFRARKQPLSAPG